LANVLTRIITVTALTERGLGRHLVKEGVLFENTKLGQEESYEGESSPDMATGGGGRLREKLENLYKMRAVIEVEIEALKRSLDLLGEDSP
jgi:hypothetical protein